MAPPLASKPEYHHFIPQFILKNFSHKYSPSPNGSKATSGRRRKNKKTNLYPGDPVLNIIDLKDEVPKISESPVNRTFGIMDMYRDISNATDQYYLEKEIGKLESRVSAIIAGIRKALESGNNGFSMLRNDRDMLRKFLFIMKYRGRTFYRRFHGDESGNYNANDKDCFKIYMQEKGYENPMDVWFRSIMTILDLKMDLEGKWQQRLLAEIYPNDAMWFIMHMEHYFLAFCTPNDLKDEFVLTENCYNVHEGPNSTALNPDTREYEVIQWTSYHEFSPITPKLMLVLRSLLLPNQEEDIDEGIRNWRRAMYEANASLHFDPATTKSILEDLPIFKPRNSYSQVSTEGIQFLPGEDGSRRSHHRFTFPFFKISTGQTHKINCILLENAHLTSAIAFSSQTSLKDSLEHYLQLPADRGFKWVDQESNVRLTYFKKLESVVNSWGSTVNLTYITIPGVDDMDELKKEALELLRKAFLENLPQQPTEFMQLYIRLGGSYEYIFTDMKQAAIMRFLRIKIDVCTKGFREATREKVRENLRDLFCQLPTRRFWIYLKSLRLMSLGSPETFQERITSDKSLDGPEDVIVKVSHIVRPECLGLLLYYTVMQDIEHKLHPGLNPSSEFTLDAAGAQRFQRITRLTFASVGSICNCGIERIQKAAITISTLLRVTKSYEEFKNPVWDVDQNIEILTRMAVQDEMSSLFSKILPENTLQELVDVLFNIVYPIYTTRPDGSHMSVQKDNI